MVDRFDTNLPRRPGIYMLLNRANGKFYVGSAVDLRSRARGHCRKASQGKHENAIVRRAWAKYGAGSFRFLVIEYVQGRESLIPREQFYLDSLRPDYNIAPRAGSPLGLRRSEETKAKSRAAKLGKKASLETRARISAALRGRKMSPESIAKTAAALRGRPKSAEHRAKLSAVRKGRPGRRHTAESIDRMRIAQKNRPRSDQERAIRRSLALALSEANTGRRRGSPFKSPLDDRGNAVPAWLSDKGEWQTTRALIRAAEALRFYESGRTLEEVGNLIVRGRGSGTGVSPQRVWAMVRKARTARRLYCVAIAQSAPPSTPALVAAANAKPEEKS